MSNVIIGLLLLAVVGLALQIDNQKSTITHLEKEADEMEALIELVIMANILTSFTDRIRVMSKALRSRKLDVTVGLTHGREGDLDKIAKSIEDGLNWGNWFKKYHRELLAEGTVDQLKQLRQQYERR